MKILLRKSWPALKRKLSGKSKRMITMVQNRNKLITLFVGNTANAVIHRILEKAIADEDIAKKYVKEIRNSWEIAQQYREKINPANTLLPDKDGENIKKKITAKVKSELLLRISKGYQNIDIKSVDKFVGQALKELKIL